VGEGRERKKVGKGERERERERWEKGERERRWERGRERKRARKVGEGGGDLIVFAGCIFSFFLINSFFNTQFCDCRPGSIIHKKI
jgi:hypothetical protein